MESIVYGLTFVVLLMAVALPWAKHHARKSAKKRTLSHLNTLDRLSNQSENIDSPANTN